MRGPLANMMKQVQQMQASMQKVQEEVANMEVNGQAGGGMVVVVMTGRHEVRRVKIEPNLLKEDTEMLEDLVAAAFNDANRKADQLMSDRVSALTAGMGLPPGFKLPF
ncbi:putative nucleoid-associated protein YbaB [Gammaproteobacteria bacterium]